MTHKVIIVGAGLSGLCFARRLQEQSVASVLLEASDGVGGRIRTDIAATAIMLIWFRPAGIAPWAPWTGLTLLGVNWLSTAATHGSLSRAVIQRLCSGCSSATRFHQLVADRRLEPSRRAGPVDGLDLVTLR